MNLTKILAFELANLLDTKQITSVELTKAYLENAHKYNNLNVFITLTEELALKEAKEADIRIKTNSRKSQLDGIPIIIKDNFLTKGILTTNASKFYENFIPPYESTITQKVKDAGLICLGKANMDEFAMGSDNTTSYFGPVINPWRGKNKENKVPGGSSGGSAAAVAARIAPLSLGTDTGGSVRQPAAFCGIVGLKPTYGLCSRYGIFAFASSLDQAGTFSNCVKDNALLLEIIAGFDKNETTMVKRDTSYNYLNDIENLKSSFTVGVIKEYEKFSINEEVKQSYSQTIKHLKNIGATIKYVSFPRAEYVLPVYYIIAPVEAMSNFARFDGIRYGERSKGDNLFEIYQNSRTNGFGKEVKSRILMGTYNVLKENFEFYIKACKVRALIAHDFKNMLQEVDYILTPTTSTPAFDLKSSSSFTPLEMYYNDIFTVGISLAGLPAISIPSGLSSEGLPIGMQLIGNYYQELELYQLVYKLEQEINFYKLPDLLTD